MTFDAFISLINPDAINGIAPEIVKRVTHDSRQVQPGDVFVALRGLNVDGHDFLPDAVEKGAAVLLVEEFPDDVDAYGDVCVVKVGDTRALLGPLAQAMAGNPAAKLKLIGVTGTNGKTTVATLIHQVLGSLNNKAALLGTVAKKIGDQTLSSRLTTADPVELAGDMKRAVEAGCTHLVMEVSSHALDQKRTKGLDFEVAVFTNLSHDHLDYHGTIENYAAAKRILFESLDTAATAVINMDDAYGSFMAEGCEATLQAFGFEGDPAIKCKLISKSAEGLLISVDGRQVQSPLIGRFNAYNLAEAFLAVSALGFDPTDTARALQQAEGAEGRMERVEIESGKAQPTVLVDYAHTPDALENVLQTLADTKNDEQLVHVVFGCGGDRDTTKRPEMAAIAERLADRVTITSDNPRTEDPETILDDIVAGFTQPKAVQRISDRRKAIERVVQAATPRTIILIAGKGHETYQEINGVRHDFDDRAIAREALRHRNGNPQTEEVA